MMGKRQLRDLKPVVVFVVVLIAPSSQRRGHRNNGGLNLSKSLR